MAQKGEKKITHVRIKFVKKALQWVKTIFYIGSDGKHSQTQEWFNEKPTI